VLSYARGVNQVYTIFIMRRGSKAIGGGEETAVTGLPRCVGRRVFNAVARTGKSAKV